LITIKNYPDMSAYRLDSPGMVSNGFHSLHTDFTPRGGIKVTWVSGTDDPARNKPATRSLTETQFIAELAEKNAVRIV